jgi:hypothetical protein
VLVLPPAGAPAGPVSSGVPMLTVLLQAATVNKASSCAKNLDRMGNSLHGFLVEGKHPSRSRSA